MQDNSWDSVWVQWGNSGGFDGFSALWMQPDTTSTLTMHVNGDQVTVSSIDGPNPQGTQTCIYTGMFKADGVTVAGGAVCEVKGSASYALSWSATIFCDTPTITWSDTAFFYRAAKGHQFTFNCPPGGQNELIWGTDIYLEGSSVCMAGVHAGAITLADGGKVTIEIRPGLPSYSGSTRNGITSFDFSTPGQFDASFVAVNGQTAPPTQSPTDTPTLATMTS
nr:hypothetical protein [uncultured bacterium]